MNKKQPLNAEELIAEMMSNFENSDHLEAYITAHKDASKGELTDKHITAAIEQGKKILEKFNPVIVNLVNAINDPETAETFASKLEAEISKGTKKE